MGDIISAVTGPKFTRADQSNLKSVFYHSHCSFITGGGGWIEKWGPTNFFGGREGGVRKKIASHQGGLRK